MNKQLSVSLLDIQIINKIVFPKIALMVLYGQVEKISTNHHKDLIILQDASELNQFLEEVQRPFSLVNYSKKSVADLEKHPMLAGILDFSTVKKSSYTSYAFINNPDGSIRWFFPKANQTPCFLNLYNGSGWKSNLFVMTSKLLSKFKGLSILCDGQFSVFNKNSHFLTTNFPDISYDDFAVFTGTIGENRKAIIALSQNGTGSQFIKIPLTNAAATLVNNELTQLSFLEKFDYNTTIIPTVKQKDDQIMVSNISPIQKNKNQNWSEIHWSSLNELYHHYYQEKPLASTSFWKTIMKGIRFLNEPFSINNGLSKETILSLKNRMEEIFHQIDPSSLVPLGIGHGDFTPWNMYVGKDQLHIYDWEMSQPDFPLLFDVFHYFFQKGILIKKDKYATIWNDLQIQLKTKEAENILATYSINQSKHFQLYLLYIVSYYLPKYIAQPKLHDQVHWLISTWLEAVQTIHSEGEPSLNFSNNEKKFLNLEKTN